MTKLPIELRLRPAKNKLQVMTRDHLSTIVYVLASPSFVGPNMTVYSLSRNKKVQLKVSILNSADDHQLGIFISWPKAQLYS